jgi:FimV-like protein
MFLSLKDFFRLCLFALGGLLALNAWSLQISKPVLLSYLGQPLKLQFFVTDVTQVEQQSLRIGLAEPHIYASTQSRLVPGLDPLQFDVTSQSDGSYRVIVSGTQPMVDENAELIVDFDWATGRRYMSISMKLDQPPSQAQSAPAAPPAAGNPVPATAPISTTSTPPSAEPANATATQNTEADRDPTSNADQADNAPMTVKRGDTASELLISRASSTVSLDQLLMAMLQQNPNAFVEQNVNRLLADAVVKLPTPEQAAAIDRREARESIRIQVADFQAYRAALAAGAPNAKQADNDPRSSSGKLKADVAKPDAPAADELKLSKPNDQETAQLSQQLQAKENAEQAKAVSDNLSQLGQLSQAASQFTQGLSARFPALAASYDQGKAWLQQHVYETIAGLAVLMALWVAVSMVRRPRAQPEADDESPASPTLFHGDELSVSPAGLNLPPELNLDLDMPEPAPAAKPPAPVSSHPAPPVHLPDHLVAQAAPVDSAVIDPGEDPFEMRLELADELWKLGQKQTALALAQEVLDQTHGQIRDKAQRWLKDRA